MILISSVYLAYHKNCFISSRIVLQVGFPRKQILRQTLVYKMFIQERPWDEHLWKGEGSRSGPREKSSPVANPAASSNTIKRSGAECPFRVVLNWHGMAGHHLPDQSFGMGHPRKGHDIGRGSSAAEAVLAVVDSWRPSADSTFCSWDSTSFPEGRWGSALQNLPHTRYFSLHFWGLPYYVADANCGLGLSSGYPPQTGLWPLVLQIHILPAP